MPEIPEPWLRGDIHDVSPVIAALLYSFRQAREDLARHTGGLTTEQIWLRPFGLASVGFHLRHIAGSVDRLGSYLLGRELSEAQLATLAREMEPGPPPDLLLAEIDRILSELETHARAIDPEAFSEPRAVGRKKLPTTVGGLMVHIAEHTQRHVGQAVTTSKLVRGLMEPAEGLEPPTL